MIIKGDCVFSMFSGFEFPFTMNFMSYKYAYCLFPQVMSHYDEAVQLAGQGGPVGDVQRRLWERFRECPEYSEFRWVGDERGKYVQFTEDDISSCPVGVPSFRVSEGVVTYRV